MLTRTPVLPARARTMIRPTSGPRMVLYSGARVVVRHRASSSSDGAIASTDIHRWRSCVVTVSVKGGTDAEAMKDVAAARAAVFQVEQRRGSPHRFIADQDRRGSTLPARPRPKVARDEAGK